MCGIAGIISNRPLPELSERLRDMSRRLEHRGPDDRGYLQWSGEGPLQLGRDPLDLPSCRVGLSHRRLAVLDPSQAAWQPMSSRDNALHLVFNGEIYNYLELREELIRAGYHFQSRGDTEVLLAALSHWGTAALPRLVGMFAFALLDTKRRRLLLVRDPFGIKPLYYSNPAEGPLVFASETKAFAAIPEIPSAIHPGRLLQYLRFGLTDHGSETLIRNIQQVPAASWLEFSVDDLTLTQQKTYWRLEAEPRHELSIDEAASELQRLFLQNIQWHLRSDVPVGAALSGGIDSASIVLAMRKRGGDALNLNTFTYIAPESEFDEQKYADLAGSAAGAKMSKTAATSQDLVQEIEALIRLQDEPFGSTSIYAQQRVFQASAAAGIKVMLDGQGADEILAGYRYFFAARTASLLRRGHWLQALRLLRSMPPFPGHAASPAVWMHAAGLLLPPGLRGTAMQFSGHGVMPRWLNAEWFRERTIADGIPRQARGPHYLNEQLQISLTETSLPALLRYEDRNSMANSVESRVPFLTTQLVEFVLSLPESYLLSPEGTTKAVFRRAMRGLVPETILSRRDKIGFATPEAAWLKSQHAWVTSILESDAAAQIPAIRPEIMKRDWQNFLQGRSQFDFRFWRWINLIRWAEIREIAFD